MNKIIRLKRDYLRMNNFRSNYHFNFTVQTYTVRG